MIIELKVSQNFEPDCSECKYLVVENITDDLGCGQVTVAQDCYCDCDNLETECPEVEKKIEYFEDEIEEWDMDEVKAEEA